MKKMEEHKLWIVSCLGFWIVSFESVGIVADVKESR